MGTLFLLYLLGGRGHARRSDDDVMIRVFMCLVVLPMGITLAAPYIWWVRSRDAGRRRLTATIDALLMTSLAVAGGLEVGWWLTPLVLFAGGLVGLWAIDRRARGPRYVE